MDIAFSSRKTGACLMDDLADDALASVLSALATKLAAMGGQEDARRQSSNEPDGKCTKVFRQRTSPSNRRPPERGTPETARRQSCVSGCLRDSKTPAVVFTAKGSVKKAGRIGSASASSSLPEMREDKSPSAEVLMDCGVGIGLW